MGFEEYWVKAIDDAFKTYDQVYIDDTDNLLGMISSPMRPRGSAGAAFMETLAGRAREPGKRLVLAGTNFGFSGSSAVGEVPRVGVRSIKVHIPAFKVEDFAVLLASFLGEDAGNIDPAWLFRLSPQLSTYQMRAACAAMRVKDNVSAAALREVLEDSILTTNLNVDQVADVKLADLKGFGDIEQALEAFVVNPLLQDSRIADLGLMPSRGVLLYGPPGTGKTSIGRALARRMKGKFFLIDGTFVTEPPQMFYHKLDSVFSAAKQNTPAVIFIDDADVLFQSDRQHGLSRYLLTQLDGLESATAGKVAVIMTAMNPNHMPPAVLRSGRVELWLETKLPDAQSREEIVRANLEKLPSRFHAFDPAPVVAASAGFNAADLKRLVNDAKALYARDVLADKPLESVDHYLDVAARRVVESKTKLDFASSGKLELTKVQEDEAAGKRRRQADEAGCCG
jgi:ATP-dependent 26S proteasome regulatory subunit